MALVLRKVSSSETMSDKAKTGRDSDSFFAEGGSTGVLLIHGLGGNPMTLRFLCQNLVREGYTVSAPFVPGLAGGSDLHGLSRWQDWYEVVEREYLALAEQCDRVVVGGLSTGALLSLNLAKEYGPKIEALTLYAPTLLPDGWGIPWTFKLFSLVRQKWFANLFNFMHTDTYGIKDDRIRKMWLEMMAKQSIPLQDAVGIRGGKVLELRRLVRRVREGLSGVTNKTLIMHPREDDMTNIRNSFEIVRTLSGPTELIALNNSYHMVPLDHQRELVAERTIDFVQRALSEAGVSKPSVAEAKVSREAKMPVSAQGNKTA